MPTESSKGENELDERGEKMERLGGKKSRQKENEKAKKRGVKERKRKGK